jgi:DNA-binding NtrC family response regulator
VQNGEFRQDLFYRLDTLAINVPPLRDRPDDIPLLVNDITASESQRMHREPPIFTDEVFEQLMQYSWPGNVRELKNMVKRLIILQPGQRVGAHDIDRIFPTSISITNPSENFHTRQQAERSHIIKVLRATKGMVGGKKGAASLLDMPRSTLQYRLKKLKINPDEFR